MKRREFSGKTKRAAFLRADGHCEYCGINLRCCKPVHFDHVLAADLGGEPTLQNCKLTCVTCHKAKTKKDDMPLIAKGRRIRDRNAGIRKPRRITRWRKMNGTLVHASRER